MKRRDLLISAAAAFGLSQLPISLASAADSPKRKLLFFTKSSGFEHSAIRRNGDELSFAEKLMTERGPAHGFEVECSKDGTIFDGDLGKYDVFLFYTTGDLTTPGTDGQPPMSADGKKRFLDAIAGGKGFAGTHSAADTFHSPGHEKKQPHEAQEELDPYIEMIGGEFMRHGKQQDGRQTIVSPNFPGLEKIADDKTPNAFRLKQEEWYSLKNFADDLHVLLVLDTQGMEGKDYERPPYPATWARKHGEGRVFYTSMGHREDVWENPKFQSVLFGGLAWASRAADADVTPNIKQVTPGAGLLPPI